jgi:site-specific DNA recombinase
MTIIGYLRVSTEAQQDGSGIEQQRASIMAYAYQKNFKVSEWVVEAETGTIEDREQIQLLLERARRKEFDTLLVDRIDRMGRLARVSISLRDAFVAAGVQVVFAQQQHITDDPAGKMIFTFFSGLAEYQREEWLKRMQQCKTAAVAKKGTFRGGQLPYGYRTLGNGQLAIEPGAADLVRRIFALKGQGHTVSSIARCLFLAGFRNGKGKPLHISQITKILKREAVYRGHAVFGSAVGGKPAHPPILET